MGLSLSMPLVLLINVRARSEAVDYTLISKNKDLFFWDKEMSLDVKDPR